jgi:hypothetical protein
MNRETAITQQNLNMVDQYTPQGTSTYAQVGKWEDGTPRYSQTTSLSPEEQQLYNQQTQLGSRVNDIALNQADRISGVLSSPINLNNEATEGRLFELGRKRLDPAFAQRRDSLETQLMNRGYDPESENYKRQIEQLGQQENDAYNSLLLSGRAQATQEALTERNQPINEITALMSGGQVSMPQFQNTPQSQVSGVDYAGLVQNNYANQVQAAQAKSQQQNAMLGGLFGLGGAALGGWGRGGFKFG